MSSSQNFQHILVIISTLSDQGSINNEIIKSFILNAYTAVSVHGKEIYIIYMQKLEIGLFIQQKGGECYFMEAVPMLLLPGC